MFVVRSAVDPGSKLPRPAQECHLPRTSLGGEPQPTSRDLPKRQSPHEKSCIQGQPARKSSLLSHLVMSIVGGLSVRGTAGPMQLP